MILGTGCLIYDRFLAMTIYIHLSPKENRAEISCCVGIISRLANGVSAEQSRQRLSSINSALHDSSITLLEKSGKFCHRF